MTKLDCIPCLLTHALKTIRKSGLTEELENKLFTRAFEESKILLDGAPAPVAAEAIYRSLAEITGVSDPFRDFKVESTETALKALPRLREAVSNSEWPFRKAVELSIAGNAIDLVKMDEKELNSIVNWLGENEFDFPETKTISRLEKDIHSAKSVFFIGDNAGETVFDRLILEQIQNTTIYYGVRGGPVLNDATALEAEESGICDYAELVSSESSIPGTMLDSVGERFIELFNTADIVIAKGQGNLETLDQAPRAIYHLFKAKCKPIAQLVGREVGDFVIWRNSPISAT
ncbi:DUF89 family protein [bacterium]|nr:DUF89 family protein [bacterium]